MFNSYEMTRALVAERQQTLHHEARQHRLARGARRGASSEVRTVRRAAPVDPAQPIVRGADDRLAA